MRKKIKVLCFMACLAIIAFFAGEIAMRVERKFAQKRAAGLAKHNIYSADRRQAVAESLWEIPWVKYRPNASIEVEIEGVKHCVEINRFGFRTKDFSIQKPDHVLRIVCIGASTTFQGRTNKETYPAILERILKERYPKKKIEVLNLGISCSRSYFWLKRIDELFQYQPDIVIQYNAVNDIMHEHLALYRTKHLIRPLLNLSFLFQRCIPLDPHLFEDYFRITLEVFQRMAHECHQRGVEYLVGSFAFPDYRSAPPVFQDYLDQLIQDLWGKALLLKYYRDYQSLMTLYNQMFEDFMREKNLLYVLVHERMNKPEWFTDLCHFSLEGLEELAKTFLPEVIDIIEKRETRNNP